MSLIRACCSSHSPVVVVRPLIIWLTPRTLRAVASAKSLSSGSNTWPCKTITPGAVTYQVAPFNLLSAPRARLTRFIRTVDAAAKAGAGASTKAKDQEADHSKRDEAPPDRLRSALFVAVETWSHRKSRPPVTITGPVFDSKTEARQVVHPATPFVPLYTNYW